MSVEAEETTRPGTTRYSRHMFLAQGGLVLGLVTTGKVTVRDWIWASPIGAGAQARKGAQGTMRRTASFGWELSNINNNGADTFFQVARPMTLVSIDIDIAFMLVSSPLTSGFAEVLCTGQVSHGAPPSFSQGPQAYNQPPVSTDFGTVHLHNPNDLQGPYNTRLGQDQFLAVILKTWVPANGAASSTERHVTATPGLDLKTGDYIVFHMDHAGVGGDVEMQVVLTYDER